MIGWQAIEQVIEHLIDKCHGRVKVVKCKVKVIKCKVMVVECKVKVIKCKIINELWTGVLSMVSHLLCV